MSCHPRLQQLLAGVAWVLFVGAPASLQAAVIPADGAVCSLGNAILSANADAAIGGCLAGSGADTILLGADAVLIVPVTAEIEGSPSGLPAIASAITIQA